MAEAARRRARAKRGKDALTPRQLRFVEEYVVHLNATKAAIAAGYSKKAARAAGAQLRANPNIEKLISQRIQLRSKKVEMSADRVLQELARVAGVDIAQLSDPNTGRLLKLTDMPEDARRAIESIREQPTERGLVRSVKMHSKVRALDLLMDYYGLKKPIAQEHRVEIVSAKVTLDGKLGELRRRIEPEKSG